MSYNKSPFDNAPSKNVQLSHFDRSHEWKAMLQPGYLVPCLLQETLPNDKWKIKTEFLYRFQPMYFPVMARMTMRADYFYFPNRILWPEEIGNPVNPGWKKWIAENHLVIPPEVTANMEAETTVWNNNVLGYMGVPTLLRLSGGDGRSSNIANLNAFPLSGYLAIWDEYYRNPQLEDPKWFALTNNETTNNTAFNAAFENLIPTNYYKCLSSKWMKDYLTSALPEPQIGEAIAVPLNNEDDGPIKMKDVATGGVPGDGDVKLASGVLSAAATGPVNFDESTTAIIKQLRIAEVLQSFYERIMKVGERYRDFLRGLWGKDPEPGVVDVPILFGSVFGRVQIADVMTQSSNDVGDTGISRTGDYSGQANMYDSKNEWMEYTCREHGFIMCIMQVNVPTSYGQGIHRLWRRTVQTDYALDMFAHIGDQEILKEEVLYNNVIAEADKNQETFGYIDRFGEYKYQNDLHIMQLNFNHGKSMHLGRIWDPEDVVGTNYDDLIEINSAFINASNYLTNPPVTSLGQIRITDVWRLLPEANFSTDPTDGTIIANLFHTIHVLRSLPTFSTPDLT